MAQFEKLAAKRLERDAAAIGLRDEILSLYLQYAERANNWDLVDLTAPKILGHWLLLPTAMAGRQEDRVYKLQLVDALAQSTCLWRQRMSMVCTWKTSQQGDPSWCLRYAEMHVSMSLLRDFLRQHAHEMPRTMLRYAIEKMPEAERREWMDRP